MVNTLVQNIVDNINYITPVITALATWLGVKKYNTTKIKDLNVQIEHEELNNISKNIEIYQNIITNLEETFKTRIKDMEADINRVTSVNAELRAIILKQEKYIVKLQNKIIKYESKNI